jgi:hypothetical protein
MSASAEFAITFRHRRRCGTAASSFSGVEICDSGIKKTITWFGEAAASLCTPFGVQDFGHLRIDDLCQGQASPTRTPVLCDVGHAFNLPRERSSPLALIPLSVGRLHFHGPNRASILRAGS